MSISVIVTSYNDGVWLEGCLASIAAQETRPTEIILVDDGTTDPASLVAMGDALERYPTVRVIRQHNLGPSVARNSGLDACSGRWVAFVDADDRLRSDNLKLKLSQFDRADGIIAAYAGYVAISAEGTQKDSSFRDHVGPIQPHLIGKRGGLPGGVPLYLFRTEELRRIGGLDPTLSIMEDFDALLRLGRTGGRFAGCNEPVYLRTVRENSLSRSSRLARCRGSLRFLRKAAREGYFGPLELSKRRFFAFADVINSVFRR